MVLHASEHAPEQFNLPAYHLLPINSVHYEGEAVAVVVADNRYRAEDAAELVDVEYEELRPVLDPEASLSPDCEQLFEDVVGNLALEGRSWLDRGRWLIVRRGCVGVAAPLSHEPEPATRHSRPSASSPNTKTGASRCGPRSSARSTCASRWLTSSVCLKLRVRVIAPQNIGGGFGWKSPMYRETAVIAGLATQ